MAAVRILAVVLFHVFFDAGNCVSLGSTLLRAKSQSKARLTSKTKAKAAAWTEVFEPPTMLIISSPMERKVSYAQIKNFKAVGGTVLPILDAGLVAPYGVAWDSPRSALYICDGAQRKIFRVKLKAFKCLRQCKGLEYQLKVDGNLFTVVENVISQWASVSPEGDLFFTDQESNAVNKLPVDVIDMIVTEKVLPKDLKVTTEPEAEGEEAAKEATEDDGNATQPPVTTPSTTPPPAIYQLYQKDVCEHVGTPSGVAAQGSQLYWANQVGGFSAGSVCEGKTNPRVKKMPGGDEVEMVQTDAADEGAAAEGEGEAAAAANTEEEKPTFPSFKLANNSGSSYGVALTASKIIFSDTSHYVYAVSRGTGEVVALTHGLLKPRGIVWDGDQTIFVADQEGNYIVSMPVGLLKENAPSSHVLDIHSPFGLALMNKEDKLWDQFKQQSGARGVSCVGLSLATLFTTLLAALH